MSRFAGRLSMADGLEGAVDVVVDVIAETLTIRSGDQEIGTWPLAVVGIRGEDDGFHLRMEGEEVLLVTDDEAGFAIAVGMRSASPIMRRRISGSLDRAR